MQYNRCFQLCYLTKTGYCWRYISSCVCVDKTIHFFWKKAMLFDKETDYLGEMLGHFLVVLFGDKSRCFLTRNWDTSSHVCSNQKKKSFCQDIAITQGVFFATIQVFLMRHSDMSCHVCGEQNRYLKPRHNIFQTLTKWFCFFNWTRP